MEKCPAQRMVVIPAVVVDAVITAHALNISAFTMDCPPGIQVMQ